jgi:putative tryptophan/tyrosine transport system substrate-binding protein
LGRHESGQTARLGCRSARVAVIWNANDRGMTLRYGEVEKAARVLNVKVQPLAVRKPEDMSISRMTSDWPSDFL